MTDNNSLDADTMPFVHCWASVKNKKAMDENIWNIKNKNGKLPKHSVISRLEREEWEAAYLKKPSAEMIKKQERAYNALLDYEKNFLKHEAKYINPQMAKIPKGERMGDFAMRYGTTIKEMKNQWRQVESALANES
jgi:hypothetical protein